MPAGGCSTWLFPPEATLEVGPKFMQKIGGHIGRDGQAEAACATAHGGQGARQPGAGNKGRCASAADFGESEPSVAVVFPGEEAGDYCIFRSLPESLGVG